MPLCINLLAEAQTAEEQRRKDPVKRAAFIAGFLVFLVVLWSMTLQFKIMASKSELTQLEARWKNIAKTYESALETRKRATDVETKLSALQQMTTNRFLWGNALNAVQQSLNGIEEVHVMRLKTEQIYTQTEEVKGRKDGSRLVPGKPATAAE